MERKQFLFCAMLALSLSLLAACGGGGSSSSGAGGIYTISGTVSGLTGTGLVLQNNGADDLAVAPTGTHFTFATKIASNAVYSVTVLTGPTGTNPYQTCAVTNASGTASADVTNVLVTCSTSTWEMLASLPGGPRFSDFTPAGQSVLYTFNTDTLLQAFTFPTVGEPLGHFSALTGTNAGFSGYAGPAWVNGKLYQVQNTSVYAYDIAGNSWTMPVNSSLTYSHSSALCTGDDSGYVYSLATSTHELLKFNTADSTFRYFATPIDLLNSETRAAWDSKTRRVYLGSYARAIFYAFNPATETFTPLASAPGPMSDALCSDRRGRIFASNTGLKEVWMYTAATDTWSQFQETPFMHDDWESCTVSADGWLYYGSGTVGFGRFKIF